jgi:hypothetical protein
MRHTILALLIKYQRQLRLYSIVLVGVFGGSTYTISSNYSELCDLSQLSEKKLKNIVHKIVKVETSSGKYTTVNALSGAYGRYQIISPTAIIYSNRLNIPLSRWKKSYNQDKIFMALTMDNIKSLKRHGHALSAFSIYGCHQQGAAGFNAIMNNTPLSKSMERNLRANLPDGLKKVPKLKLKSTWKKYWRNRLS